MKNRLQSYQVISGCIEFMGNSESEADKLETERRSYNDYILRDGIHEKIKAKIDAEIRLAALKKAHTRVRELMRQRSGLISHDAAMKIVLDRDNQKILDELLAEAIDEFGQSYPLIAENLRNKNPQIRKDALLVLEEMQREAEQP